MFMLFAPFSSPLPAQRTTVLNLIANTSIHSPLAHPMNLLVLRLSLWYN